MRLCDFGSEPESLECILVYIRHLLVLQHAILCVGGSLAKVAYLSEVRRIRPRHYSSSGSFMGSLKSSNLNDGSGVESDAEKQVNLICLDIS